MKTLHPLLRLDSAALWLLIGGLFILACCAGCAAGPASRPLLHGPAAVRIAVSAGATVELAKHPERVAVALALADGIDAAIGTGAEITPERIAAFVRTICARHEVEPAQAAVFTNLAQLAYQAYATAYRTQVVSALDPDALLYIGAFKTGLRDAIAAVPH